MAAFLVAMTGCQKEPQAGTDNGTVAGEKVYMKLKIQAVDTRSETDNNATEGNNPSNSDAAPDYEVGKDYENTISKVDIVLKGVNNSKFIVASNVTPTGSGSEWLATFTSGNIAENDTYKVYIYANRSASQDENATSTETIANITKEHNFWMTNAYQPKTITVPELSTNPSEPTNLGSHYVERSMARFDYMAVKANNEYALTDNNAGITVTLTHAAIINQSKEFYLLRRAYQEGNSGTLTIGYPELPTNYVVDTDWTEKTANVENPNAIADNFDAHLSTPGAWNFKSLNLTEDDSWEGTDGGSTGIKPDPTHGYKDYKIFGYAKENTLPNVNSQVHGLSTGIVFKGVLSGDIIDEAAGKAIYAFGDKLYGTWDQVTAAAASNEAINYYVANVFTSEPSTDEELTNLATAGFTRYAAVDGKYNVYYYYWNRHNDNSDNQQMGDMEFAVVRNNVYKLCVDYISKLGHPTPGQPDPDPVDPEDPDESGEYYFGVSVKVVPWVVRVNHIGW